LITKNWQEGLPVFQPHRGSLQQIGLGLTIGCLLRLVLVAFQPDVVLLSIDTLRLWWFPVQAVFLVTDLLLVPQALLCKGLFGILPNPITAQFGGSVELLTLVNTMVLLALCLGNYIVQHKAFAHQPSYHNTPQSWYVSLGHCINRCLALIQWVTAAPSHKPKPTAPSPFGQHSKRHATNPWTSANNNLGHQAFQQLSRNGTVLPPRPASPVDQANAGPQACIPTYQGQMKEATVIFSDIRGYTTLVEQYPAHQVIYQLNQYFSAMTEVIFRHGGRVDKYLGDGMLVYFEPTNGHIASSAQNAVNALYAMQRVLQSLNRRWEAQGLPTLQMGAGVNSGVIFIGNVGSQMKMDLTILGDNVNLAARLEQLNKHYGTQVIMSETTQKWIKQSYQTRFLGNLRIRGKQNTCPAYELILEKTLSDVVGALAFAQ